MTDEPDPIQLADERIEDLDRRVDLLEHQAEKLLEDNREVFTLLAQNQSRLDSLQNRLSTLS